jgi:hypothetical protein
VRSPYNLFNCNRVVETIQRINTQNGSPAGMTDVSRGIFGATVGIDRLLKLWEKYHIKASWFVPAHSVESFPKQIAKIRDAGHEM